VRLAQLQRLNNCVVVALRIVCVYCQELKIFLPDQSMWVCTCQHHQCCTVCRMCCAKHMHARARLRPMVKALKPLLLSCSTSRVIPVTYVMRFSTCSLLFLYALPMISCWCACFDCCAAWGSGWVRLEVAARSELIASHGGSPFLQSTCRTVVCTITRMCSIRAAVLVQGGCVRACCCVRVDCCAWRSHCRIVTCTIITI
jgi:hypothetical protein